MAKKKAPIKKPKPTKERADKYEDKLHINGTFDQLAKELITPKPKK